MSDKGKEQWAKVPFNVSHNILGCDVVFGDGTTARLGRQDVNKKIFQQISNRSEGRYGPNAYVPLAENQHSQTEF